jgi:dihydrofolate reductase
MVSSTLPARLPWQNSTLLDGALPESILSLKQAGTGDLHVIVSARLVQGLLDHDLVDELRLMIDPVLLGGGKRIFPNQNARHSLALVQSQPTNTGAILATYARSAGLTQLV